MSLKKSVNSLCLLGIVFSISIMCFAFENEPSSARSLALGGVRTTLVGPGLEGAILGNPAALSLNKSGILFHYNNRFGLSDYINENICLFWSGAKLGMGFAYQNNGVTFLEEKQGREYANFWGDRRLGFGLGTRLKGLNFGINLWQSKETVKIEEDLSWLKDIKTGLTVDFGILYNGAKWGLGLVMKNSHLAGTQLGEPECDLGLRLGQEGYLAAFADINLSRDALGDLGFDTHYGIEAWLSKELAIRIGVDSAQMMTAGLGINKGRLQVDYAYRTHPVGVSHYLTTGFVF